MGIDIEDLPPKMQAMARARLAELELQRRPAIPNAKIGKSTPKYHNREATVTMPDGSSHTFQSEAEARRYGQLVALLHAGTIRKLKLQPQFTIQESYMEWDGTRVRAIRYHADFSYERMTDPDCYGTVIWLPVVEDVKRKATATDKYKLKKKLMQERLGIRIVEIQARRER